MKRLNSKQLYGPLAEREDIVKPLYQRENVQAGIVHLGIGAFHRAHQAWYTEAILNSEGGAWGIVACSLRSSAVKEQLDPQDALYTIVERGPSGERFQICGAVQSVLVGPEEPSALLQQMADDAIKIVSLTVTEKGYCHDPATGDLNVQHPDIGFDLDNLSQPKTAIGYIVSALKMRRQAGVSAFTVMSCDNLPHNGRVLQKVVIQFAKLLDAELADWIARHVSFPSTMVDRIVPATTQADKAYFESHMHYRDEGLVIAEPFSQWVIEDDFCNARPAWETVGALLVSDVEAYEKMKLRLLNGSHSLLAYCGYLAGKETISEVMAEPVFVELTRQYMDKEATATLEIPSGFDIENYKQQLRERFANPGLRHRTWQIAMDGSQKLPQRLLDTLREQIATGGEVRIICLAVAAWMRYVSALDEAGNAIDVQDPYAGELQECHQQAKGDVPSIVRQILSIKAIFGEDLQHEPAFVAGVCFWLERFYRDGVLASLRSEFSLGE